MKLSLKRVREDYFGDQSQEDEILEIDGGSWEAAQPSRKRARFNGLPVQALTKPAIPINSAPSNSASTKTTIDQLPKEIIGLIVKTYVDSISFDTYKKVKKTRNKWAILRVNKLFCAMTLLTVFNTMVYRLEPVHKAT